MGGHRRHGGVVLPRSASPAPASLTLTGIAPTLSGIERDSFSPGFAELVLTGIPPTVGGTWTASPSVAALVLTGIAPAVRVAFRVSAAALVLTGIAPTVTATAAVSVSPTHASLTVTGIAPTVLGTVTASPSRAALVLTAQVPAAGVSVTVSPTRASLALTGIPPNRVPVTVSPMRAALVLHGVAPSVRGTITVTPARAVRTITRQTPTVTNSNWTTVPGWVNVFNDDFADRTVALGHFMDGATDMGSSLGFRTADHRYLVRRPEWRDTSGRGTRGDGAIVEITGGQMVQHPYTDSTGFGHNCIMGPLSTGATTAGDLSGGLRFAIRVRGNVLAGHKCVPLLWPSSTGGSGSPNFAGEADNAEASWDKIPKFYFHSADGFSSGVQAFGSYPAGTTLQDFHEYACELRSGVSLSYLLDGVVVTTFTEGQVFGGHVLHIPTAPMHPVMQFETSTDGEALVPNTTGLINIDRVGVWVPA